MVQKYIEDIYKALENKCYFAALSLTLTLPDICGVVEMPDASVTERYITWFDKYVTPYINEVGIYDTPEINGEMIYNLRNQFLHGGIPEIDSKKIRIDKNKVDRFDLRLDNKFLPIYLSSFIQLGAKPYRSIYIDVSYLCDKICSAVKNYYWQNQEKFYFSLTALTPKEAKKLFEIENKYHAAHKDDIIEIPMEDGTTLRLRDEDVQKIKKDIQEIVAQNIRKVYAKKMIRKN